MSIISEIRAHRKASTPLQRSPTLSLDHKTASASAFIVAQASVLYTFYWAGHTEGVRESGGMLADLPYTLNGLHIVISFCLGLSFVGLWLRRRWALIISMLALISVLGTYAYWHLMTVKYLSELVSNIIVYRRVQQETGLFLGATKWDFVVLAWVAMLLLWHVVTLFRMTLKRRRTSPLEI